MTETILAFDPGGVTGWSLWLMTDSTPMHRIDYGLVRGGIDGMLDFFEQKLGGLHPSLVICERFNPDLGDANKEYDALEITGALRGACRALGIELVFQDIGMKAQCKDSVLKRLGLWIDGPEVEHEDGRDVNDSQIHALAWAKVNDHVPTVEWAWPPWV